jgi:hypothetical protein
MLSTIDKIEVVGDEIDRPYSYNIEHDSDYDDDSNNDQHHRRHIHAMTPPEQDFSYLKHCSHGKRSVHYDQEQMNDHEHRPLRTTDDTENSLDSVLRRRYIAHWGLPGLSRFHLSITRKRSHTDTHYPQ